MPRTFNAEDVSCRRRFMTRKFHAENVLLRNMFSTKENRQGSGPGGAVDTVKADLAVL